MIDQKMEEVASKVDNIFILLNMAAKRARQLNAGSPKLVDIKDTAVNIALEEIRAGKINWQPIKKEKVETETSEKDKGKKVKKKK